MSQTEKVRDEHVAVGGVTGFLRAGKVGPLSNALSPENNLSDLEKAEEVMRL